MVLLSAISRGEVNKIVVFFILITEILNAPIRQLLDAVFNSYTRINGICTKSQRYIQGHIKGDKEETRLITIAYAGGKKTKKVPVGEYANIKVGSQVSIIKGKISGRVINIENYDCNIKNYF